MRRCARLNERWLFQIRLRSSVKQSPFIMSTPTLLSPGAGANLYDKVIGCWLGKAVGGTPFEGHDGPLDLTYYLPVPTGMLPNDDLDLQVVWACALDAMERPRVDRELLALAWQDHVEFPWDEYGVAKRNLALGLRPPFTGSYDNWFAHGFAQGDGLVDIKRLAINVKMAEFPVSGRAHACLRCRIQIVE